jgi:hypothetical protein
LPSSGKVIFATQSSFGSPGQEQLSKALKAIPKMLDVQNAEFVALFRVCDSKNFNKEVGDLFKRSVTQATVDGPCENIARCN